MPPLTNAVVTTAEIPVTGDTFTYTCGGGVLYFHSKDVTYSVTFLHDATHSENVDTRFRSQNYLDIFQAGDEIEIFIRPKDAASREHWFRLREI